MNKKSGKKFQMENLGKMPAKVYRLGSYLVTLLAAVLTWSGYWGGLMLFSSYER